MVEHQQALVDDVPLHAAGGAALAQLQRAFQDARARVVKIVGAENQGAAAGLGQAPAIPVGIDLRRVVRERARHLEGLAIGHVERAAGRRIQPVPAQGVLHVAPVGVEVAVLRSGRAVHQHLAGAPCPRNATGGGDQPHRVLIPPRQAGGYRGALIERNRARAQAAARLEGQGAGPQRGVAAERQSLAGQGKAGMRGRRQRAAHQGIDIADNAQGSEMIRILARGQFHAAGHPGPAFERQGIGAASQDQRAIARIDAAAIGVGEGQVAAAQVGARRPDDAAIRERRAGGERLRMAVQVPLRVRPHRQRRAVGHGVRHRGIERAGGDGGGAGVGVLVAQCQGAGAGLRHRARARNHARVGRRVATVKDQLALIDDVSGHGARRAVVAHAQRARLHHGIAAVGVVAAQDQRARPLLGQAVAVPVIGGLHLAQRRAHGKRLVVTDQERAMRLGRRVEPGQPPAPQEVVAVVGLAGTQGQIVRDPLGRVGGVVRRFFPADGDMGEIAFDLSARRAEKQRIRRAALPDPGQVEADIRTDADGSGLHACRRFTRRRAR